MDREITVEEKRKHLKKQLIPILAVGISMVIIFIIIRGLLEDSLTVSSLDIGEVDRGPIEVTITASGTLSPLIEEIIVSPINSKILETYKTPGDTVQEGEPLLKLDLASVETEYKQKLDEKEMWKSKLVQLNVKLNNTLSELKMQQQIKEMQLRQLHTDLRSEIYLDSIGAGTPDKVRRAELDYEEAKLSLSQLKQKIENEKKSAEAELNVQQLELGILEKSIEENIRLLKDARVLSPRKATLTYINNLIGSQVARGDQLAVVSDLSRFKVNSEVADGHREKLIRGAKAIIKTGTFELPGTVINITPSVKNGVIDFVVVPDDSEHPGLRSGLKTEVYVMHGRRQEVLRIPNGTWFKYGKGDYLLWVINGDRAEIRKVRLGESSFEYVEVEEGLTKGERVILSDDMDKYKNKKTIKLK
jgi:Membrane-fusion protein